MVVDRLRNSNTARSFDRLPTSHMGKIWSCAVWHSGCGGGATCVRGERLGTGVGSVGLSVGVGIPLVGAAEATGLGEERKDDAPRDWQPARANISATIAGSTRRVIRS